ncbi:MAG: ABC transporter permease [Hyphomicrobiaceae bacterium]|nr:ABC transporter permease [Hyphomicrobiaceae bacterium]
MSGSYDRPPGPPGQPSPLPPPPAPRARVREPYYSAPSERAATPHADSQVYPEPYPEQQATARTTPHPASEATPSPEPAFEPELTGNERPSDRRQPRTSGGVVVPAGSVTSRSLTLVIAIMCFLACLTAGGVYILNQSASSWLRDIAREVTVQIEPRENVDTDRAVRDAAAFLARQPGIKSVKPLNLDESSALLEPWLGKNDALKSLPVPRLIALEIDAVAPPDMDALRALIATELKSANLDDHRHWQTQIRTFTHTLALGGLAILMLVGAATTAIIISATRSSMASNREIVEVLHLVGATDRYIAREFERHFLRLGVRAGLVGAGFAMLVFLLMPSAMDMFEGNVVTTAEVRRLFGAGILDLAGYGVLVMVVVVIAALCMLTSRFGVYHILDQQR